MLSNPAWCVVWHPCKCSVTRWFTTLLDLILEHAQHCCNSKGEGQYDSLCNHYVGVASPELPAASLSAHLLLSELNHSRGAWSTAWRNQGCQLSNAIPLLLRSSICLRSSKKRKGQTPLTTAAELIHPSVPLCLPVAQNNPPNPKPKWNPPSSKQPRTSPPPQRAFFFLIVCVSLYSFALVWIATPILSRI